METLEYAKTSRGKQERKRWKFKRRKSVKENNGAKLMGIVIT